MHAHTHTHTHIVQVLLLHLGSGVLIWMMWCFNWSKSVKDDLEKLQLPCAGHTLKLSVQKAFAIPEVQTAISRAKKVVEHFDRYRIHHEEFEEKQQLPGLDKHKLIQAVQHSWNSVYNMIKRVWTAGCSVCCPSSAQGSVAFRAFSCKMEAFRRFI